MKPDSQTENDAGMQRVLQQWKVDAPLPPAFQDQVWKRISRQEPQAGTNAWAELLRVAGAILLRPRVALSYVTILLVVGVAAGSLTAQVKTSHLDATLRARYVQSLDPYHPASSHP